MIASKKKATACRVRRKQLQRVPSITFREMLQMGTEPEEAKLQL